MTDVTHNVVGNKVPVLSAEEVVVFLASTYCFSENSCCVVLQRMFLNNSQKRATTGSAR